ncbi:MAG: type IIL restriction-modification enzyme MmeI, partial [Planctomyces sp.]
MRLHPTCIVIPVVSKFLLAARVPSEWVFTNKFLVFEDDRADLLGIAQSALFECWVRTFSGSLGETLSISLTDGVNTFPLPRETLSPADKLSRMIQRSCEHLCGESGFTDVYNRFHDPDDSSTDIKKLRDLHVEVDQAVAAAYGWTDLDLGH